MCAGNYGLIRKVVIFLIFSWFISSASAFETSQLQWGEGVSGKLQLGEVISYMDYSVKIVMFPPPVESDKYRSVPIEPVEPFVGLNISKNGSFINTAILIPGDTYIVPDGGLKVTAIALPAKNSEEWLFESYAPWATIKLSPRGTPNIEVSVATDKNEYISSSATEIDATVTIKNTGLADAVNVHMYIDTELQIKRGSLKYHYERIKKGETITSTITFSSPILNEKKSYGILANMSGYDVMDISYAAKFQKTVSIAPEPLKMPSLRKSTNSKIYLKDYAMVSLSLKNNEKYDLKNVSITDYLPDGFRLVGNNSLHWAVDIPAFGEWENRYLMKPQIPDKDGIVLPAATAEFFMKKEYYIIRSNQPEIVVYGPKIVVNKQADVSEINPGDAVTVTVTAENEGSTPTMVVIRDELPEKVTIISGSTALEGYLEANKKISFSYTLKVNSEEPVKLPPANAEYFELGTKGGKINTASQELEIRIKSQSEAPVAAVEPTPIAGSPGNSSNVVTGLDEPVSNEPNVEPRPEPAQDAVSKETSDEVNIILKFLLGCDDNNNSRIAYSACNFFNQNNN